MDKQELRIETPVGTIVARLATQEEYKGVCVALIPNGYSYELDLVDVEYSTQEPRKDKLAVIVWGSEYSDEPTSIEEVRLMANEERRKYW